MHLHIRRLLVMLCTLGLLLGSLSAALGRGTPAHAATPSGAAYAWGANGNGQLGNGTIADSNTPVPVSLPSGVTATVIAAGSDHSLAIGSDTKLYGWGLNDHGQLGDGTTIQRLTPVPITLPNGATATEVAAGSAHSLAIGSDGNVYAWGYNGNGQLGNGTNTESHTPVMVSLPGGVTATAIAAGSGHSLAIDSNGKVYAWGDNSYGQLGNNSTNPTIPMATPLPNGATATKIAAGYYHSLAIDSNGKVYAWGANFSGQLGNGTTAGSSTPVAFMLPGGVAATEIAAGYNHSLAIDSNGKGYAWGLNNYGQLGNGIPNNGANPTPVAIMLPSNVTATKIAGGSYHSLAIGSDKKIYAWGANTNGQLGNTMSNQGANGTPMPVSLPAGMIPLALGAGSTAFHSLAILTSAPTAAILSRFRVVHAGNALVFRWRVASGAGVRGFFLTAGTHRLNSRLIQSHAQRSRYAYASWWQGHGPYLLHGVLPGGAVVTLASTG